MSNESYIPIWVRKCVEILSSIEDISFEISTFQKNFLEPFFRKLVQRNVLSIEMFKLGCDEMVIERHEKYGEYSNLLIDRDGDISYMRFSVDKERSRRKLFFNGEYSLEDVISCFLED